MIGVALGLTAPFQVTFLATCKTTKKEWACKTISKRKLLCVPARLLGLECSARAHGHWPPPLNTLWGQSYKLQ
jgi:hypothetical protein